MTNGEFKLQFRAPTLDENNRIFTGVIAGWAGAIGSTISFLYAGAMIVAVYRLIQKKISLPERREFYIIATSFLAFYAVEGISGIINYREPYSLSILITNIPFLGFILIVSRLHLTGRSSLLRALAIGLITGAVATFLVSLFQVGIMGEPRAWGLAGNPGPFALVCAVVYGSCLVVACHFQGMMRLLAFLAAIAAAGALILSGMRALWPILGLAPLVIAVIFRGKGVTSRNTGLMMLASMCVLLMASYFLFYENIRTRIIEFNNDIIQIYNNDYNTSIGHRIILWGEGVSLIMESPIIGHGPKSTLSILKERSRTNSNIHIYTHFHNFMINATVRSGVLGLLAIFAVILSPFILSVGREKDEIATAGFAILCVVLISYLLSGATGIMFGHDILDVYYIYLMSVLSYLIFPPANIPGDSPPSKKAE